ncbi:MAG: DUF2948 family protein [Pseudomonadota bacterium]
MPDILKLAAMDAEDLLVLSAHAQDAVIRPSEIVFEPKAKSLVIPANRFAWEAPGAQRWLFKSHERRRAALHVAHVTGVASSGMDRNDPQAVLSLLTIAFHESQDEDDPGGTIELTFAGGAAMRVAVECIEIRLTDLGGAWEARSRPRHGI